MDLTTPTGHSRVPVLGPAGMDLMSLPAAWMVLICQSLSLLPSSLAFAFSPGWGELCGAELSAVVNWGQENQSSKAPKADCLAELIFKALEAAANRTPENLPSNTSQTDARQRITFSSLRNTDFWWYFTRIRANGNMRSLVSRAWATKFVPAS